MVVEIGISLTTSEIEPFFLGLLAICPATSVDLLFLSSSNVPPRISWWFDWPQSIPSLCWLRHGLHASFRSCAIMCVHGCIFVGGGSSWHFRLQVLSWEAVSALQLVPSIRKAAHREIRHSSKADCWEFGRELAGHNLPLSLFLSVSFPFPILNNCLIVKRDDSHLRLLL